MNNNKQSIKNFVDVEISPVFQWDETQEKSILKVYAYLNKESDPLEFEFSLTEILSSSYSSDLILSHPPKINEKDKEYHLKLLKNIKETILQSENFIKNLKIKNS
jgi:hypothetical protein